MAALTNRQQLASLAVWFLFLCTSLILALGASFIIWGYFDYGYSFLYHWLHIDEHLVKYAAQNVQRPGFHLLSEAEHVAIFKQIVVAVHHGGVGLSDIAYHTSYGHNFSVLNQEEIIHLKDVASLFTLAKWTFAISILLWLIASLWQKRLPQSQWRARAILVLLLFTPLLLWLLIAGPEQVFYQLHVWIFPANNEWFFYWEESHMSAMMKAPELFGGIAILLTTTAAILLPFIYVLGLRLFTKFAVKQT